MVILSYIYIDLKVDAQTIEDLEFSTIRHWLSEFCISETAKNRLLQLSPSANREFVLKDLNKLNELVQIRKEGETFPVIQFEELIEELKLLPIENSSIQSVFQNESGRFFKPPNV